MRNHFYRWEMKLDTEDTIMQNISPKVQNQFAMLQQVQQQLQTVLSQKAQYEMAVREAELRWELGVETGLIARVTGGREKTVEIVGRKVRAVWAGRSSSGSFDCGAHDNAVSASAQDDSHKVVARKGGRA